MNSTELTRVNILSAAALGLPANALFLWLITKRSPPEMAVYRQVLLQSCLCDFTLLLLLILIQPIFFFDTDIATMWFSGPLGPLLPNPWNTFVDLVYVYLANASLWQPCAQFFYRYMLFNRNHQLSVRAYYLIVSGVALAYVAFFFPILFPNTGPVVPCCADPAVLALLGVDNRTAENLTFAIRSENGLWASSSYLSVALDLTNFVLMLFFRTATLRFLRRNMRQRSGRSAEDLIEMHRQLNLVLTLQAVFPLMTAFTDVAMFAEAYLNFSFFLLDIIGMLPMYWFPALAPLFTIFTVQRYRNVVFPGCCQKQRKQQQQQQQQLNFGLQTQQKPQINSGEGRRKETHHVKISTIPVNQNHFHHNRWQ